MRSATTACLLLTALIGASAVASETTVYMWVDEDGVPQYTDRPPDDADVHPTRIQSRRTDPEAVQARVQQDRDLRQARAERRQQDEEAAAEEAARRNETLQQRQANCEQARQKLETYENSRRLYRPLPNGEREYLTDEELDQARAQARAQVREWCD